LGRLPKKFLRAKNMPNLARFRSTSKFGGEYLRNGWRYSKSVSYLFDSDSSRIRRNKSGEDRSSNLGDLDVCTHRKRIFQKNIFRPLGGAAPQFFTRAREWPSLTSAPPPGTVAPPYNFFLRGVKNWLKMQKMRAYNFGVRGCRPTKLWHLTQP